MAAEPEFEKLETSSVLGKWALPIILGYLAVGVVFFHFNEEDMEWIDALYFCAVTLTTVGYGDLAPQEDSSKIFFICYIMGGLSIFATCFGLLMSNLQGILEGLTGTLEGMSSTQRYLMQVARSVILVAFVMCIGATFVHFNEGWEWLDSFYWSVVTASTVGYGDLTIVEESTRYFAVGYVLIAAGVFAFALSSFGSIIMDIEAERHVNAFVKRGVSLAMLEDINATKGRDEEIDRMEFLQYMLVTMGKVSQEDLDKVLGMFDMLDEDGSGKLDRNDVLAAQQRRTAQASGAPLAAIRPAKEPRAPAPTLAGSVKDGTAAMARGLGLAKLAQPLLGGGGK